MDSKTTDIITVYTQPGCQPCKAVKRQLDGLGLTYRLRDVSVDSEARDELDAQGYNMTPVTRVDRGQDGIDWIAGYSPDRLKALVPVG